MIKLLIIEQHCVDAIMSFHYFGVYKHAIHKVIKSIASLTSVLLKHRNEQHGSHAWNDAIINQSYIAYLRAGLPIGDSELVLQRGSLPSDIALQGRSIESKNGVSMGRCGVRTSKN